MHITYVMVIHSLKPRHMCMSLEVSWLYELYLSSEFKYFLLQSFTVLNQDTCAWLWRFLGSMSYTWALNSNTFCFILLPKSSLSFQKTENLKKNISKLCGLRSCTDSHVGSPASNNAQGDCLFSILNSHQTEIVPSPWLEKKSTGATAQLPPGPQEGGW